MQNLPALVLTLLCIFLTGTPFAGAASHCEAVFSQKQSLFGNDADIAQWLARLLSSANTNGVEPPQGRITIGVATDKFILKADPEGRGRQRCSMWCWAAATQMVMAYHGVQRDQAAIATQFGVNADGAGTVDSTLHANTGTFPDQSGRAVSFAAKLATHQDEIIDDLTHGRPLIIGINNRFIPNSGHEYVLTALEYSVDAMTGKTKVEKLILRNPFPGRPSRMELDIASEGGRIDHVIRVLPKVLAEDRDQ